GRRGECEGWRKGLRVRPVLHAESSGLMEKTAEAVAADVPLSPTEAAQSVLNEFGLRLAAGADEPPSAEPIEDVASPSLLPRRFLIVLAADNAGRLQPTATAAANTAKLAMAQSSFAAPVAEAQGGREAVVLLLA